MQEIERELDDSHIKTKKLELVENKFFMIY